MVAFPWRTFRNRSDQRAQGSEALRGDRSKRVLSWYGSEGKPFADERDLPLTLSGIGEDFRTGSVRGRTRWIEGPSVGRRDEGLYLQCFPGKWRRCSCGLHARV